MTPAKFSPFAALCVEYNDRMFGDVFRDKATRHATAILVGTMVGVGIFGIPFVFAKAGFWVGAAWLVFIMAVTALFNLMFAELMLRTPGNHQLAGYARAWLGDWARGVVTFCNLLGIYGALLAYTLIVGQFLHNVLSNFFSVDPQWYSILFTAVLAPVILARLRTVAVVEQFMTALFVAIVGIIAALGLPHVSAVNYAGSIPDFWFLPYGVLLFAFAGVSSLPIMRQILTGREAKFRGATLSAVGLVGLMYLLFAATVVGVSGDVTTPDALRGLFDFLGQPVIIIGSLLGILTISTSYLMLGTALHEIFHVDYKVRAFPAWLLTVVPPLAFFFARLNFIDIIGTIGAVAVGLEAIIFIFAYLKARRHGAREPEFRLRIPGFVWYLLAVVFAAGLVYALVVR